MLARICTQVDQLADTNSAIERHVAECKRQFVSETSDLRREWSKDLEKAHLAKVRTRAHAHAHTPTPTRRPRPRVNCAQSVDGATPVGCTWFAPRRQEEMGNTLTKEVQRLQKVQDTVLGISGALPGGEARQILFYEAMKSRRLVHPSSTISWRGQREEPPPPSSTRSRSPKFCISS